LEREGRATDTGEGATGDGLFALDQTRDATSLEVSNEDVALALTVSELYDRVYDPVEALPRGEFVLEFVRDHGRIPIQRMHVTGAYVSTPRTHRFPRASAERLANEVSPPERYQS